MKIIRSVTCALVCIFFFSVFSYAQNSARRRAVNRAPATLAKPIDSYWTAQRNIETALSTLEAFINKMPSDDPRRQTAIEQVRMLREIRIVPHQNQWTTLMNEYPPLPSIEWRIASVDAQREHTRINLEIRNAHNREQCFQVFDDNPLILIDNRGTATPMLNTGRKPEMMRSVNEFGTTKWCLAANQMIMMHIDFAPLANNITSGQINYSKPNAGKSKPTGFSLFQQKIK